MSEAKRAIATITVSIGMLAAGPSFAQSAANSDAEIAALKQQLRLIERKLDTLQKQTAAQTKNPAKAHDKTNSANADADIPVKSAAASGVIVKMPNNRPTICTADNLNCVAITSRLQFDAGGYDYRPNSGLTTPQMAQNGVNARRARIGLLGTFAGDWDYGLVYDLGGTQDGAATLENAFITYNGIKGLYIDGGYIDVPYTLDEATGSNNILFLERASSQTIATNIAGGDNRSAFGAHGNGDWWWVGSYVTGPTSGFSLSNRPQVGATARGVVVPVNNQYGSLLLGADAEFLFDTGGAAGTNTLSSLNDRIEVRIDPATNALLNTGALTDVKGARVLSGEAAGQIGSFYAQGEYFDYGIVRFSGLPDLHFRGGYAQASYVLTGERRKYNAMLGAYGSIDPTNPVRWATGGWGAWEIAVRYSQMSLNDQGIMGGELKNTTVGLNWYVDSNMRFMFDWIHGRVAKTNASNGDIGAHYDVFAMRTQVAF